MSSHVPQPSGFDTPLGLSAIPPVRRIGDEPMNGGLSTPARPRAAGVQMRRPSSNDPLNTIVEYLANFMAAPTSEADKTDNFPRKAIESIVKKLKDRRDELDELICAISTSGNMKTKCVTIPRTLDGRLQVAGRKGFPHVVYAKTFRFPDLNKNELRHVSCCIHAFDLKTEHVCVNPYHYERAIGAIDLTGYHVASPTEHPQPRGPGRPSIRGGHRPKTYVTGAKPDPDKERKLAEHQQFIRANSQHIGYLSTAVASNSGAVASSPTIVGQKAPQYSSDSNYLAAMPQGQVSAMLNQPDPFFDPYLPQMTAQLTASPFIPSQSFGTTTTGSKICPTEYSSPALGFYPNAQYNQTQFDLSQTPQSAATSGPVQPTASRQTAPQVRNGEMPPGFQNDRWSILDYPSRYPPLLAPSTSSAIATGLQTLPIVTPSCSSIVKLTDYDENSVFDVEPFKPDTASLAVDERLRQDAHERASGLQVMNTEIRRFLMPRFVTGVSELHRAPMLPFITQTPLPVFWCKINYYEYNQKIGETYKGSEPNVYVDGGFSSGSENRFCVGALSNLQRTTESEMCRLNLGRGAMLTLTGEGDIWLTVLSSHPIFVESHLLDMQAFRSDGLYMTPSIYRDIESDDEEEPPLADAYECRRYTTIKVFDLHHCFKEMREMNAKRLLAKKLCNMNIEDRVAAISELQEEPVHVAVDYMQQLCGVKLSFIKGFGNGFSRKCVKNTPCWISVHSVRALQILDEMLYL